MQHLLETEYLKDIHLGLMMSIQIVRNNASVQRGGSISIRLESQGLAFHQQVMFLLCLQVGLHSPALF
jgi:hypothetical protein